MFTRKRGILAAAIVLALTGCGVKKNETAASSTAAATAPAPTATASALPSPAPSTSPAAATFKAADEVKAYQDMLAELNKGANGGKADYDKVQKIYVEQFKKFVLAIDPEASEQQLSSAIKAGKDGSLSDEVVTQLVDKLGQKVMFLAARAEFRKADTGFTDKAKAAASLEEAKTYFGILKVTAGQRDAAYGTGMAAAIDGGFTDAAKAVDAGNKADFSLARQVIDKTAMRVFYLAAGADKGYAYQIEQAVKEGKDPKAEQAAAWASFQSLYSYLATEGEGKADADFIMKQFDLTTNTKDIKADPINKAFVRGFAKVAKDEYAQSFTNFGQDKGPVTALEGAMFIRLLELDAKKLLGEAETKTLLDNAGKLVEAAKAKDRAQADSLYKTIEPSLDKLAITGK